MNDVRYGIFLRPDPETCWAVTQIVQAVRLQFGLVSAAAFAPHATLIGNLRSRVGEQDLVELLDGVFSTVSPITIYNHGIENFAYNVNLDESGQAPNEDLAGIARAVRDVVLPIHLWHTDYLAPNVQDYQFAAHLTLAGFDISLDRRLRLEVDEFIRGLPITAPPSFQADWYTLFEFRADWDGRWWENMPSRHVKSWDVR